MFGRARAVLTIPTCILVVVPACSVPATTTEPAAAQAPGPTTTTEAAAAQAPGPMTTAFDGTYAGVSRGTSSFTQGISAVRWCASKSGAPAPLTITNGVVRSQGGGRWEGSVSPRGVLVMRNARSVRVEGQIDSQGTIRGQYSGWACVGTYVWQRQSP
jgi:hypothetical protein